jgi:hypothetical protein
VDSGKSVLTHLSNTPPPWHSPSRLQRQWWKTYFTPNAFLQQYFFLFLQQYGYLPKVRAYPSSSPRECLSVCLSVFFLEFLFLLQQPMVSFILFAPAFLDYMELENQKVKCLTQKGQEEKACIRDPRKL